ncbi:MULTISPECIES: ThiF family adenylyltransferase [Sinorhizobium]|uniref:THIF-type NAD/FAD binding fold domain-containing protein n=1 Tax=Sinorhizobium americanum TaxID=194963 RepID=A0A2S3YR39_9HYPH|nr:MULTISPECIES: ThiF family adenylyltransferase [Sinorhizobium]PDT35838.1 hypothetical protein CO656_25855 [Sinorhizobium sp. FG01]PDT50679.1 hypothetical protein CO664_25985 [Sinorhizobium sp. NG07B]POH33960.1 hypothetical protein ATY30_01165 [Sinorhizobium americanum]POH33991.1 hypothetical protein ATY31_09260 [Sinorhizobium americanum]
MSDIDLGDRHRRAVSGLGNTALPKVIKITAGQLGNQLARQHLLVCLVNLLARLHGSVKTIKLQVSGDITVPLPHAPPLGNAFAAMENLAAWANGGRIPVLAATGESDITIDISYNPVEGAHLYACGAGWKSWIGVRPPDFALGEDEPGCLGPYFAATMLAGEVFKMSKGLIKGRYATNDAYSLWTGEVGAWDDLADGPPVRGTSLPAVYLVGAGAVGQGVMQVLGASELADAYVVTIDHVHHDKEGTNLNRCFLAGIEDILEPKVDVVSRYRGLTNLNGFEFKGRLGDYLIGEKVGLRPDLVEAERADRYDLVVSAVDINRSRQDIQGLSPTIVIGGSTDSLRAQATSYGVVENAECLGCWNEPEDDRARAILLEASLRSLSVEERRHRLAGQVGDLDAALAYLAAAKPRCGQLGESDVRSFTTAVSPEFSVSFVSMAAAVMTAARLFTVIMWPHEAGRRAAKGLFQFKSLKADNVTTPRRAACPHCGKGRHLITRR